MSFFEVRPADKQYDLFAVRRDLRIIKAHSVAQRINSRCPPKKRSATDPQTHSHTNPAIARDLTGRTPTVSIHHPLQVLAEPIGISLENVKRANGIARKVAPHRVRHILHRRTHFFECMIELINLRRGHSIVAGVG